MIEKRFAEVKEYMTGREMAQSTIKNNAKMIKKISDWWFDPLASIPWNEKLKPYAGSPEQLYKAARNPQVYEDLVKLMVERGLKQTQVVSAENIASMLAEYNSVDRALGPVENQVWWAMYYGTSGSKERFMGAGYGKIKRGYEQSTTRISNAFVRDRAVPDSQASDRPGMSFASPRKGWKVISVEYVSINIIDEYLSSMSLTTERNYYSLMLAMLNWSNIFQNPDFKMPPSPLLTKAKFVELRSQNIRPEMDSLILPISFAKTAIVELERKITQKKEDRKVSPAKSEQQVSPKFIYDLIAKLRAAGHEGDALMIELLMVFPYRAEVGTLRIMTLEAYNNLKKRSDWQGIPDKVQDGNGFTNWLIVGPRKMIIYRSNYKTFDKYGHLVNEITNKTLKKNISTYIQSNERLREGLSQLRSIKYAGKGGEGDNMWYKGPLLFSTENKQEVSKRLSYITKKYSGISLGPAAIVKVSLSNRKFKDAAEAADFLRDASRIRGTALNVLQDVYLHSTTLED